MRFPCHFANMYIERKLIMREGVHTVLGTGIYSHSKHVSDKEDSHQNVRLSDDLPFSTLFNKRLEHELVVWWEILPSSECITHFQNINCTGLCVPAPILRHGREKSIFIPTPWLILFAQLFSQYNVASFIACLVYDEWCGRPRGLGHEWHLQILH